MGVIIDPKDKKYFITNPKDFSPERNKVIINETIAETTKYFEDMMKAKDDDLANRIDILSSYGVYRFGSTGGKDFEKWAGRKLQNELIGEKILSKVRVAQSVNKLQGNRKNSILI
jgi:hypothetical protein